MSRSTLEDLTRNDCTLIESKAKRIRVELGQEIIKEGARIDHLYVLRRGSASVEVEGTTSRAVLARATSVAKWRFSATARRPHQLLPRTSGS
jgi:CRP-like cAMP-binding protein